MSCVRQCNPSEGPLCVYTEYTCSMLLKPEAISRHSLSINSTLSPSKPKPAKHRLQQLEPNSAQLSPDQIKQIDKHLQLPSHIFHPTHPIFIVASRPACARFIRQCLSSHCGPSPISSFHSRHPELPQSPPSGALFVDAGSPLKRRILSWKYIYRNVGCIKLFLVSYYR